MRFTDPNQFVHVKYNGGKKMVGSSLRVYEVPEANSNVKITTLQRVKGPLLGDELVFGDGSRVSGPNYQKLIDFLKERDMYVNCLGRVLVTSALHKDPPDLDCFRIFDYFPWHEYGGPPNLKTDESWIPLDLKQKKVAAAIEDKEKELREKLAELQKKYDDLEKRNKELEAQDPKTFGNYSPIGQIPVEATEIWSNYKFTRMAFTPQQFGSKDYGFANVIASKGVVNFESERSGLSGLWIDVVAYTASTRIRVAVMTREMRNGNARSYVCFPPGAPESLAIKFVDRSVWKNIGVEPATGVLYSGCDWYESKPGSIWYG